MLPLSEGLHLLFCVLYNAVSENYSVQNSLWGEGSIASPKPIIEINTFDVAFFFRILALENIIKILTTGPRLHRRMKLFNMRVGVQANETNFIFLGGGGEDGGIAKCTHTHACTYTCMYACTCMC